MSDFDKSRVRNLPAHAQIQAIRGTIYVYFAYCFSINGKRKQERDYIGTIDKDSMKFVPNGFFLREKPSFQQRALSRWKDPDKRRREESRRGVKEPSKITSPLTLVEYIPQLSFLNQLNEAQDRLFELINNPTEAEKTDAHSFDSTENERKEQTFKKALYQVYEAFECVLMNFLSIFDRIEPVKEPNVSSHGAIGLRKEKVKKHADQIIVYLLFQLFDQLGRNMEATRDMVKQSHLKSPVVGETINILNTLSRRFNSVHLDLKRRFDIEGIYNNMIAAQYLNAPREED